MKLNRRFFLGGAALAAGGVSAARAAAARSDAEFDGEAALADALAPLEAYVARHREEIGLPGVTVAVATRDGFTGLVRSGLAEVDSDTPVGPDQLFHIGSISKMVAALAVWSLIEDGALSPETKLADALPDIKVRDDQGITLRHLLEHTSGLPRDASPYIEGGLWTGWAPGEQWMYCNLGYRLAGMIAAKAHGGTFQDCVEARVLKPLGMDASRGAIRREDRARHAQGYEPALLDRPALKPVALAEAPWADYDAASGCVTATAPDMAKFLRFLIDLSDGKGGPVFSDETAARFLADAAAAPGWSNGATYANGIAFIDVEDRPHLHHTGGMVNFCSSLHVDREAGTAAFASANVHYGVNYRPREITAYACALLRAAAMGDAAPAPNPPRPMVKKPERYAGTFTAEDGARFEVVVADDGGLALNRGGVTSPLQPVGASYFATGDEAFRVTGLDFELEDDKAVRAWAGSKEYLADPASGYVALPPDLLALEGRYASDEAGRPPIRVYARDGELFTARANYISTLSPLEDGAFRVGDETNAPDRVRFSHPVDGRPQKLTYSGDAYIRRFS